MKQLFKDNNNTITYTMVLAFVFLITLTTKACDSDRESIITTKKLFYNKDTTRHIWIADTVKFTFGFDSTVTIITETEDRILKIKDLSINDDYFKEDGILCDIYEFEEKLTLYIDKNPDNGQILQLILFDWNTGKSYTYKQ